MGCSEIRCRRLKRESKAEIEKLKSERDAAWERVHELQRELHATRRHCPTATLNRIDLLLDAEGIGPPRLRVAEDHCEARVPFSEGDACGNPMPCDVHAGDG